MIDGTLFPTWDPVRRQKRLDVLLEGARAGVAAAEALGREIRITGSAARGEVHPWSDLDLLMLGETNYDQSYHIENVVREAGVDDVSVISEDEVIEPLRPGLVGGAILVEQAPTTIRPLPDPQVAIDRAAFKIKLVWNRAAKVMDSPTGVGAFSAAEVALGGESAGLYVPIKRLAVYADGGRSSWLESDWDRQALSEVGMRLALPADAPFTRPALVPLGAAEFLPLAIFGHHVASEAEAKSTLAWIGEWAALLDGVATKPSPSNDDPSLPSP